MRANTVAFGYVMTRLTQAKEAGAAIEIDGKKVALGIPGGRSSVTNTGPQQGGGSQAPPGIPLGRGATTDEAAAAMLLYVSVFFGWREWFADMVLQLVVASGVVRFWTYIGGHRGSGYLKAMLECIYIMSGFAYHYLSVHYPY